MKMNKFKTDYYIYGGGKFDGKETSPAFRGKETRGPLRSSGSNGLAV